MITYYTAIFLPLLSFITVGCLSKQLNHKQASTVSCTLMSIATLCSYRIFYDTVVLKHHYHLKLLTWLQVDQLTIEWGLSFDPLSCVMLIVIMTISTLVHFYSIEYMAHDHGFSRFMAYLGLFTFMMLMLVMANNLLQLFFGWEGVGLASYLLIGFWYHKESANAAAMKAFIVNRVGDLGLILAMGGIYYIFNSLDYATIFAQLESKYTVFFSLTGYDIPALEVVAVLLFIGAMGKSAQIGLHTWLPDAMEGPTPVSALIHAATMVTAGVFLIVRLSPLFEHTVYAKQIITVVGATTAFFAGTIALMQYDIKRVIAYSTCSQLGYMFFAAGLGHYNLAIFHLFTHAFFKALLFLGSGSVIHALSGEQDMRKMGDIYRAIPYTYGAMWIGSLALTGFPLLAGYYSKDAILDAALNSATWYGQYAYIMGIIAALLTALYSGRLILMTFHGTSQMDDKVKNYIHESGFFILSTLAVLSLGALTAGYIGFQVVNDRGFWQQAIVLLHELNPQHNSFILEYLPTIVCLAGLTMAGFLFSKCTSQIEQLKLTCSKLYNFLYNKWYIDELYQKAIIQSALNLGQQLWIRIDQQTIDRFGPNGVAKLTMSAARIISRLQSGYLYHYALVFILGFFAIVIWLSFMTGFSQ